MKDPSVWKKIVAALLVLMLSACAAAWWGYAHLTELVQLQLKSLVGNNLSIGKVTARWNRVELERIRLVRRGPGSFDRRMSIDHLVLKPRLASLFSGRLDLGEIEVEKPYLLMEIAPNGSLVPLFPPDQSKQRPKTGGAKAARPISIDSIRISGGTLEILDWHAAQRSATGLSSPRERYHLSNLYDIKLETGKLEFPPTERSTTLRLSLKSQGGGEVGLKGNFTPKNLDSRLRLDVSGLNITRYRPYFLKKGDLGVSAGFLSAGCDISIDKRNLKAPGTITLKGLEFEHSGAKGTLMGVPAWALLKFMSNSSDELKVSFEISGNLDNPRFVIRQSLMDQIATALSSKLGISTVTSVGKGIMGIGEKGVKGVMGIFGEK